MAIMFHGTPITPTRHLLRMAGMHFCVSFANPQQADLCEEIGSSVLWDNGGFSAFTKGVEIDKDKLYSWLDSRLYPPHKAVMLDVIGGSVKEQRQLLAQWPFPKDLSIPVWHMNLPLDYLKELCETYGAVCFGSSGEFWRIGTKAWRERADAAFEVVEGFPFRPYVHGLRMASMVWDYPFASVDSTNVAQNWHRTGCAYCKAKELARRK